MSDQRHEARGTFLTEDEHAAVKMAGDLWGLLCRIVGDEPVRRPDLAELIIHVHAIQRAVMAQAAGRAYPDLYRRLGLGIQPASPSPVPPMRPDPDIMANAEGITRDLEEARAAARKELARGPRSR